nr:hypothetical protein [Tanacetum cinerariifolium]
QPRNFAWEIADSGSVKSVFKAWEQRLSSSEMLSEQNKKNRSFNLISPAVGTKSAARRINMERRENVTAVDSYEIAHYCGKKKKMVSEEAVAVLDALLLFTLFKV